MTSPTPTAEMIERARKFWLEHPGCGVDENDREVLELAQEFAADAAPDVEALITRLRYALAPYAYEILLQDTVNALTAVSAAMAQKVRQSDDDAAWWKDRCVTLSERNLKHEQSLATARAELAASNALVVKMIGDTNRAAGQVEALIKKVDEALSSLPPVGGLQ